MKPKYICKDCATHHLAGEELYAENPFCKTEQIMGCKQCGGVNTMERVCDKEGCWEEASCGTPTGSDYLFTCHNHIPVEIG